MDLTTTIRAVGGSLAITIPKAIVDELNLKADTRVALSIVEGQLVVKTRVRPKYKLEDLLAQCDFSIPESAEEREWLDAPAVGREWGSPDETW